MTASRSFLLRVPRPGWGIRPGGWCLLFGPLACLLLISSIARAAVAASGSSGEMSSGRRIVLLLLPGVHLEELLRPEMIHLRRLATRSAGTWVSVWSRAAELSRLGGQVTPVLRRDPGRPYGVAADVEATASRLRAVLDLGGVAQIDLGDTTRASRYAPLCAPEKAAEHRLAALRSADRLVGMLLRDQALTDLWLLAPPLGARRGLAPFFWWRAGAAPGLLRSGSTHMTGVITGADLLPTLAQLSGKAPVGSGGVLEVVPAAGGYQSPGPSAEGSALQEMRRVAARSAATEGVRAVANRPVQWLLLALLAAALLALRGGRRLPEPVSLASLLLPALLIADGAMRGGHPLLAAIVLLALLLVPVGLKRRQGLGRPIPLWQALAAVTALACGLAMLSGDCLRWAVMGHSIELGVRFYGIGNEYMGWWVGATLLALGPGEADGARPARLFLLLGLALLIAHPGLGADLGGGITALGIAGVEAWHLLRRHSLWAAALLVGVLLMLIAVVVWDAARPSAVQTHLGRLAERVGQEGLQPLWTVAAGKLATNLRVSSGLWGVLAVLGVAVALVAQRAAPKAEATQAVARLLPAALIALLVNDSGVMAAALMLSYGTIAAGGEGQAVRRATHSGQGQR